MDVLLLPVQADNGSIESLVLILVVVDVLLLLYRLHCKNYDSCLNPCCSGCSSLALNFSYVKSSRNVLILVVVDVLLLPDFCYVQSLKDLS